MGRYKSFDGLWDRDYRDDLNKNFEDISNDVTELQKPIDAPRIKDKGVTEPKVADSLVSRMLHGVYQVSNGLTDLIRNSDGSITISFDDLTVFIGNKAGVNTNGLKTVKGRQNLTIPSGAALIADLSITGDIAPFVTTGNVYNSATWGDMAFADDSRIILIANNNGKLHGYLNTSLPNLSEDDVVLVSDGAGTVDIYVKSSTATSRKYIKYPIRHIVDAAKNADVWRINEVWETEKRGNNFVDSLMICNYGEIELAIRGVGWTDNVGGSYHGNEKVTDVIFMYGGLRFNQSVAGSRTAKEIKLIVKSDLYNNLNPSEKIAECQKVYNFTKSGVVIEIKLKFLKDVNLVSCYMVMIPIIRRNNQGVQVTNEAMRSYDWKVYDVSQDGFNNDLLNKRADVDEVGVWGNNSGISVSVKILQRNIILPNNNNFFKNDPQYNKFYFDFSGSYQVKAGEIFEQTAEIKINTRN